MSDNLKETKKRVQKEFLGQEGIHGLGINRSQNAIKVYTKKSQLNCLDKIKEASSPYQVIVVKDDETPYLSSE